MTLRTALASHSAGLDSSKLRYVDPIFEARDASSCGSSAWQMSNPPNSATSRIACSSLSYDNEPYSSTPLGERKHLKPNTPASHSFLRCPIFVSSTPPQKPSCTCALCKAHCFLRSRASQVNVGGFELSGMSSTVVTPPAAAAWVAHSKPSHSVRPGSLMCTCVSTMPGISTSSFCRCMFSLASTSYSGVLATVVICPLSTTTVPWICTPSTRILPRMAISACCSAFISVFLFRFRARFVGVLIRDVQHRLFKGLYAVCHVIGPHRFVWAMADATLAAHIQHGDW